MPEIDAEIHDREIPMGEVEHCVIKLKANRVARAGMRLDPVQGVARCGEQIDSRRRSGRRGSCGRRDVASDQVGELVSCALNHCPTWDSHPTRVPLMWLESI